MSGSCRVGVDLVQVAEVAEAIEHFGERYVGRVFTESERAACHGSPEVRHASLAARFAAKEATMKVLGIDDARPDWRGVEVVRLESGACELALSGTAAALAKEAGIRELAVSLTHEGPLAAAVVVGLTGDASGQALQAVMGTDVVGALVRHEEEE